jgi:PAS domain S-box-containing protein
MDRRSVIAARARRIAAAGSPGGDELARLAFELGPLPAALVEVDAEHAWLLRANGRMSELLGMPAEQLAGMALDRLIALDRLERDPHAALGGACERGGLAQTRVGPRPQTPVEVTATALPGHAVYVVQLRVVSQPSAVERELREAVRRLEGIIDYSAALIYVKDRDGRYMLVNRHFERRFGFVREEVIGRTDHDLYPPRSAAAYVEHDRLVWERREAVEVEEPAEDVGGSWLSIKFPLLGDDGEPYALAGISTDITQRIRAEAAAREARDEAERANRAKSEFLSRMSHELRTPLNAILGFGQLLELEPLEPEPRQSVERILKAGRHLLQLINEVLEVTRIEAGAQHIALTPVHVCEPLNEALELVRPLARERGIELSVDMHGGLHRYVSADFQRLKQVLLNLLSNAVKYNREEGVVRVTFADAGTRLRCLVTDTGPGLSPQDVSRAFLPFERLAADRTETEGTGLGLALSKSLMEAMNGQIGIQHTAPGEGTTFFLELEPVARPQQSDAAPAGPAVLPESWELGPATVLYVEDNLSNFELVERILDRAGAIELIPAMQGLLAVDLAAQHRPDVVLLDLDLPDIRGDEVLRRLKRDERTAKIPVLILSADATGAQVARLERLGIDAYLTKPLDIARFLDTIKAALYRGEGS